MHHQMLARRASETNPARSMPLVTSAHRIFGLTALQMARSLLDQTERSLPIVRSNLIAAHAELGHVNCFRDPARRRRRQAIAMRCINEARAMLLKVKPQVTEARAEVERLESQPELPFPAPVARPAIDLDLLPSAPCVLRKANASWPARTCGTVEKSKAWGYVASIARSDGSAFTVTTHASREAAQAWLEAEFAPLVRH